MSFLTCDFVTVSAGTRFRWCLDGLDTYGTAAVPRDISVGGDREKNSLISPTSLNRTCLAFTVSWEAHEKDLLTKLKGVSRTFFGFQSERVGFRLSCIESPPSHCVEVVDVVAFVRPEFDSRLVTPCLFLFVVTKFSTPSFAS